MSDPRDIKFQKGSYAYLFEQLACPGPDGTSRNVARSEFVGKYARLDNFGNGGSWSRSDGPLGRKYTIQRHQKGGRIVSIELMGFNRDAVNRAIPGSVRNYYKDNRCVVTGTGGQVEIDHKHGRYVSAVSKNTADYQPMSRQINIIKREHCKRCADTDTRFDARKLGYSVGWIKGDSQYRSCHGCYWFDPVEFNRAVSVGFPSTQATE